MLEFVRKQEKGFLGFYKYQWVVILPLQSRPEAKRSLTGCLLAMDCLWTVLKAHCCKMKSYSCSKNFAEPIVLFCSNGKYR